MSIKRRAQERGPPKGVLKHCDFDDFSNNNTNTNDTTRSPIRTPSVRSRKVTFSSDMATEIYKTHHPEDYDRSTIPVDTNADVGSSIGELLYEKDNFARWGIASATDEEDVLLLRGKRPSSSGDGVVLDGYGEPHPQDPIYDTPFPRFCSEGNDGEDRVPSNSSQDLLIGDPTNNHNPSSRVSNSSRHRIEDSFYQQFEGSNIKESIRHLFGNNLFLGRKVEKLNKPTQRKAPSFSYRRA